jgi:hypothetical protein
MRIGSFALALGLAHASACGTSGTAADAAGGAASGGTGSGSGGVSGSLGGEGGQSSRYGRFGRPDETFTLPAPTGDPPSLAYADVQASFPDVDWATLDRLYLPAGEYARIQLGNLPERDAARPLVITNYGGQVHAGGFDAGHPMVLSGGTNWVLSGRYDPISETGHEDFVGHAEGRFAGSQGTYGIVLDDAFSREGASGLAIGGFASDFEVEMIEIARAEFAGLIVKTDDEGSALMRRVRLHDLYVHDVGSEGLYLGSTQVQPQHAFEELEIYDNRFIRSGTEALQVGQLGDGCEIHHNVLGPGAVRWRSAFADYQNGNVQYGQRYGSSSFHHNLVIGTGDLFVEFFPQPVSGDAHGATDEVVFSENYFADTSLSGVYTHAEQNSVTVRFEDNVFRGFSFDYDEVYPDQTEPEAIFGVGSNTLNPHILRNNRHDSPYLFIEWVFDSVTEVNNVRGTVERAAFVDFMIPEIEENFRRVEWWTDVVTRHPSMPARTYDAGDFVMHGGRLYRSLRPSTGAVPSESSADWEDLGLPKDDARLTADSPYQGYGLRWPPE